MRENELPDPELESVIRHRSRIVNPDVDDNTTLENESGIVRAIELSRLPI